MMEEVPAGRPAQSDYNKAPIRHSRGIGIRPGFTFEHREGLGPKVTPSFTFAPQKFNRCTVSLRQRLGINAQAVVPMPPVDCYTTACVERVWERIGCLARH
jgi:hypothetical protein